MKLKFVNNLLEFISGTIPILLILFGVAIGLLINDIPYFSWKKEVSLGELANLVLALYVAVYVPMYLNRKINNKRTEKDIIIDECNTLIANLNTLREKTTELYLNKKRLSKLEQTRILLNIKNISNLLNGLFDECKPYKSDLIISNKESLIEINAVLWEDVAINFGVNNTTLQIAEYNNTEKNINHFRSLLSTLKILINNA